LIIENATDDVHEKDNAYVGFFHFQGRSPPHRFSKDGYFRKGQVNPALPSGCNSIKQENAS
jgi:hypothetical protein